MNPTHGAPPQGGSSRLKPIDPMRVMRTHMRWLIGAAIAGVILGVGTWGVLRLTLPLYTSAQQLRVADEMTTITPLGSPIGTRMDIVDANIATEIMRITSEGILRKALDRPEVRGTFWFAQFDNNMDDALESLSEDVLRVWPARGSRLFNVSVRTPNKLDPPKIIGAIVSVFLLELTQDATGDTTAQRDTYAAEARRLDREISNHTTRLEDFTRQYKITSLDNKFNEATRLNDLYTQQMAQIELDLDSTVEFLNMLVERQQTGETDTSPETMAAASAMPEILDLQRRLFGYNESREHSKTYYGENHPETARWQSRIDALTLELDQQRKIKMREIESMQLDQTNSAVASLQGRMLKLQPKIDDTRVALTDLTQKLAEYGQIQNDLVKANEHKSVIDEFMGVLRMKEGLPDARTVKTYTGVTLPELTFPLPEIVIPGVTFLIMALTTGIIFLVEMLDQRLKAPADVKLLKNAEMLGTLPDASEDPSGPTGIERVVEKYPTGLMAESFRQVRTEIINRMDRRGYKTLMLVAAQPGCGTSTVTQNLATSLAYHDRNVVIVDANFRRPAQHNLFNLDNQRGLVDVLRGRCDINSAIQKIDGLAISVLTTGQVADAPPELLVGGTFRSMIGELEAKFDIVLIDAPPALLSSDSQLLAKHVDAIACITRAMADKRGMVDRMIRQFETQRGDLLGVILNGIQSAAGGYFRKSYLEFYHYRDNGISATPVNGADGQTITAERSDSLLENIDEQRDS